jgi:DNA-binding XRE family transcriptional regulator
MGPTMGYVRVKVAAGGRDGTRYVAELREGNDLICHSSPRNDPEAAVLYATGNAELIGLPVEWVEIDGAEAPEVLRAVRARLRLTQTGMARRMGVDLRTYQQWEYGRRKPGATARRLAGLVALGMDLPRAV